MKNLTKLFLLAFAMAACLACSDLSDDFAADQLKSGNFGSDKSDDMNMVTVPFVLDMMGTYVYGPFGIPTDKCDINVFVNAAGTGTHLGNFTGQFDFCVYPLFDEDGNLVRGDYSGSDSYFVSANGDTLFIGGSGSVIPGRLDEHPDYVVSYWRDPFVILGGTGRFEGASGSGMTDDYNSSEDTFSHHHWEGTITMKKGKR